MKSWWGARAAALIAAAVLMVGMVSAPALAQRQRQERSSDCDLSNTGKTALTDLGTGEYMGAQGGLYPGGSNEVPDAHLALGLSKAAAIVPRDAAGAPHPDGAIGFAAIGYSNVHRAFASFARELGERGGVAPELVLVNGAQGGQDMPNWTDARERSWDGLDAALEASGVTAAQVQAVWLSMTDRVEGTKPPFPDHALEFADNLTTLLQMLQDEFPNLQIAYLSSREYGGYNDSSSPSPEPTAYEEGFGVKWTIERQIDGEPDLDADPSDGTVEVPWLVWGPYVWADGTSARSDGLTWSCSDFRGDGVHPDNRGNEKYADLIADFFTAEPTAAWMFAGRQLPDLPGGGTPVPPSSTIAPGGSGGDDGGGDDEGGEEVTEGERRRQEREQRRNERRQSEEGGTTTTGPDSPDPVPTTTAADTTAAPAEAAPAAPEPEGMPPIVWILIGAGGALGIAAIVATVLRRRGPAG